MKTIITLQEIAVSLSSNEKQTAFNLEYLQKKGIIPQNWAISSSSSYAEDILQVIFDNGVRIITGPNMVTFLEPLNINSIELRISEVANRYVEVLGVHYQEAFIDVRSFVAFEGGDLKTAHEYLKKLLSFKYQISSNLEPEKIELSLVYNLEKCQLSLRISEVNLDLPGDISIPSILVSFRFRYGVLADFPQKSFLSYVINQSYKSLQIHRDFLCNSIM